LATGRRPEPDCLGTPGEFHARRRCRQLPATQSCRASARLRSVRHPAARRIRRCVPPDDARLPPGERHAGVLVNPESVKLESLMDLGRQLEEVTDGATLTATLADSARGVLPFTACALCLKNRNGSWIVWRVPTGRPGAMTVVT